MGKIEIVYYCLYFLLICGILGCTNTYIIANDVVTVYENQYDPVFHKDIENRAIFVLTNGENVKLISTKYDKNYAYYKVKLNNGGVGYIFSGSSIDFSTY